MSRCLFSSANSGRCTGRGHWPTSPKETVVRGTTWRKKEVGPYLARMRVVPTPQGQCNQSQKEPGSIQGPHLAKRSSLPVEDWLPLVSILKWMPHENVPALPSAPGLQTFCAPKPSCPPNSFRMPCPGEGPTGANSWAWWGGTSISADTVQCVVTVWFLDVYVASLFFNGKQD
jgi:hypothetical protein